MRLAIAYAATDIVLASGDFPQVPILFPALLFGLAYPEGLGLTNRAGKPTQPRARDSA